jgi:hypothetical protein
LQPAILQLIFVQAAVVCCWSLDCNVVNWWCVSQSQSSMLFGLVCSHQRTSAGIRRPPLNFTWDQNQQREAGYITSSTITLGASHTKYGSVVGVKRHIPSCHSQRQSHTLPLIYSTQQMHHTCCKHKLVCYYGPAANRQHCHGTLNSASYGRQHWHTLEHG